jgi:ATP-binding cassette subfamily B protein
LAKREFTVANEYQYNRKSPLRWILSHILRYKGFLSSFMLATILANVFNAFIPLLVGNAFNEVLRQLGAHSPINPGPLLLITLGILAVVLGRGLFDLTGRLSTEFLGKSYT